MKRRIEEEKAAELASQYFGNGYHCAEAVAAGVLQSMGEQSQQLVSCATAFGGGYGETFAESCGVITGSLLVIGHFHGREQQGDNWQDASLLGRKTLQKFVAIHGTSNCGKLRDRFGEEEQMTLCRELVRQGTRSLVSLLNENDVDNDSTCSNSEKCTSCS